MEPDLEAFLWARTPHGGQAGERPSVRDAIGGMLRRGQINSPKQAWRTLEKWARQGKYEYGCAIDLGWRTDDEGGAR